MIKTTIALREQAKTVAVIGSDLLDWRLHSN
jgi:hypothetical protein